MNKIVWCTAATLAALLSLGACSSNNSNGGGSGAPSCKNPGSTGPGNAACNSCLQSHCASQLAQVRSSCQAFVSCYEACQCSDDTCVFGCQAKVDATCSGPAQAENMCLEQNCSQACMDAVDAGGD
jgi:hypothetical protein